MALYKAAAEAECQGARSATQTGRTTLNEEECVGATSGCAVRRHDTAEATGLVVDGIAE